MAGADHRHDPRRGDVGDLPCHVGVPFVDEHLLDGGGVPGHLLHRSGEHVFFLELLDIVLAEVLGLEDGHQRCVEQLHLLPEGERTPRAGQGHLDVPVHEDHLDAVRLRLFDGRPHLVAGSHAELLADATLEGGHDEIGHEEGSLLLLDDLEDIHVLPHPRVLHDIVAGLAELHGHGIGPDLPDGRTDLLHGGLRNMGGAHHDDLFLTQANGLCRHGLLLSFRIRGVFSALSAAMVNGVRHRHPPALRRQA